MQSKRSSKEETEIHSWKDPLFLNKMIMKLPTAIVIFDDQGNIKMMNRKAEEMVGWTIEELIDQPCPFILTNRAEFNFLFTKNLRMLKTIRNEHMTVETKTGERFNVMYSTEPIYDDEGRLQAFTLTLIEQENANPDVIYLDSLKELSDLKFALDQAAIVAITDPNGVIQYANEKFCETSQYSQEELLGKTHRIVNSGFHPPSYFKELWQTISQGRVWTGEIKNKTKSGGSYWVDTTIIPFVDNQGIPYRYVSIRNDITQRKEAIAEINYLVYNDELTGLPNKRSFIDKVNVLLQTFNENDSLAVLCIDLDRFKILNDSMGHGFGDKLLRLVAKRLKSFISKNDFLARQGSDEFIMFFDGMDEHQIKLVARKILKKLSEPYYICEGKYYLSCSIGVSMCPTDAKTAEELIKKADIAMYRVKKIGKNNFRFFDEQMDYLVRREMELDIYLRKALDEEELDLFYQPKLDLTTGKISGMEALLRWNCPDIGMVAPNEFIPLAEETGLIIPIGEWVLRKACFQNKLWQESGFEPKRVSVNLSVRQFQDPDLISMVSSALKDSQLEPKYLELEITENIAMENMFFIKQKLELISALGVHISIDDFGTGYSSLSYLGKYPVNTLKIDKAFIDEIVQTKDTSIVRAIIALAHTLNLSVVAEGVELEEQIEWLRKYACDEIQGFVLSKPLSAIDFEKNILKEC